MARIGEVIYTLPAAWVRQLPVVNVEVFLTAREGDAERPIGSYTLVHGGVPPVAESSAVGAAGFRLSASEL